VLINPLIKILLIENEPAHAELVQRAFQARPNDLVRLTVAATLTAGLELIESDPPNLIIAALQLPDGDSIESLLQRKNASNIPVIIITQHGNERRAVEAIQAGAMDYIAKSTESLTAMPHIAKRVLKQWEMLVEQTRMQNELKMRAEAESIWQTVGKTIISNQTPDQALATVIEIIKHKMQVETGTILLWDPELERIVFSKILQGDPNQFSAISLRKGEGVVGWVVENGRPALVPDVNQDIRWQSKVDREIGFVTRSILCVPLIAQDVTIGAIELINKFPGTFDEHDLQLIESIAAPLAIAIQNARLQQQVRQHVAELTEVLAQVSHAKHEWEQTVDVIDAGIWLVDTECRIMRANRTLAEWLNTTPNALIDSDCHSLNICDTIAELCPVRQRISDVVRRGEIQVPQLAGGTFRLNTYPMLNEGKLVGSVNVLQDITAEKAMQSQLVQAEKLAGIGRLAASLAHEINNPLQALQGCLDLALANLSNIEKQQRYLGIAKSEVERLGSMVQRMLDFYRPSKGTRGPMDVKALVDEVLMLSGKRLQHAKVITQIEWTSDIPVLYGVANQIKQVFLNLVLNATDAMPNGGELKFIGGLTDDHQWLCAQFIDSGVGIAPENLDKIFEPFYTTKATGTGLGLGISHTIIASHGGRMTVESEVGKGTTFTVWLPTPANHRENTISTTRIHLN
jgi:signal transduction histidine kinase/DNA-binding NarL/FixJ family response regulator